jgi:GDP-mannose transporter
MVSSDILGQVLSSIIAAWADVHDSVADTIPIVESSAISDTIATVSDVVHKLNIGYLWMLINCLTSATYVRFNANC